MANRVDRVQKLRDRIHAGKVPGLSSDLYFQLQADIIAKAQEDLVREKAELQATIEDLRRVNADLDVGAGHLGDIWAKALSDLDEANSQIQKRVRKVQDLKDLLVVTLMPWARVMGDLSLRRFIRKLAVALDLKFGRVKLATVDEVMVEVYFEKSRFLTEGAISDDEFGADAAPPSPLEKSLEEFRENYKKFVL